ncbi:hypothetical protein MBANPS3_009844 [Mucor bainieri]
MEALLTLVVKDECPQPTFYRGERDNALVIPLSQFNVDEFEKEGPSSFLSVLRQQYPDGLRVSTHKLTKDKHSESYVQVSFHSALLRKKALSTPFNFKDRTINVYKALKPASARVFSVDIRNIDLLENPDNFRQTLQGHLRNKDGDWFNGEGCAILFAQGYSQPFVHTLEGCTFTVKPYPFYHK